MVVTTVMALPRKTVTRYSKMGAPSVFVGACQLTVAWPGAPSAVVFTGALGGPEGRTVSVMAIGALSELR